MQNSLDYLSFYCKIVEKGTGDESTPETIYSVNALNDYLGNPCSLNYLRTKYKAEIDFCIVGRHAPKIMIEAKLSDETPGKSIINFNRRYDIPGIQLVMKLKQERKENRIEIRNAAQYLSSLMMWSFSERHYS